MNKIRGKESKVYTSIKEIHKDLFPKTKKKKKDGMFRFLQRQPHKWERVLRCRRCGKILDELEKDDENCPCDD